MWKRKTGGICFEYLENCHEKDILESFCGSPKERIWKPQGNRSCFSIKKKFLTDLSKNKLIYLARKGTLHHFKCSSKKYSLPGPCRKNYCCGWILAWMIWRGFPDLMFCVICCLPLQHYHNLPFHWLSSFYLILYQVSLCTVYHYSHLFRR